MARRVGREKDGGGGGGGLDEGNLVNRQRLSAAVHYGVGKFSEDLGRDLGVQFDKSVVAQVANITFERLLQCGSDLEAFARHGKRSTVNADDVKLLVRRNQGLLDHISELTNGSSTSGEGKKRKSTSAIGAAEGSSTSAKKAKRDPAPDKDFLS